MTPSPVILIHNNMTNMTNMTFSPGFDTGTLEPCQVPAMTLSTNTAGWFVTVYQTPAEVCLEVSGLGLSRCCGPGECLYSFVVHSFDVAKKTYNNNNNIF